MNSIPLSPDATPFPGQVRLTFEQRRELRELIDQAKRARLGHGVGPWARRQCAAANRMSGKRCRNPAAADADYCRNHLRVLREGRMIAWPADE